ncbi:class I SAM-dependent methyltransferase [Winogradskya consettensis]|uniref:class I SAM-dependent methyltransferase n=1 Tax=Winogradskya consettensis TaxID=113560 RepID=UPI001BB38FDF|nr:class I SAM-dependent methyltransferase [Actinoplanes consettensis]
MDPVTRTNRTAWETAGEKYVLERDDLLSQAVAGGSLHPFELDLLRDVLNDRPRVVHLQSGDAMDDPDLVRAGAHSVLGVDFSAVAVATARRRAIDLGLPCDYVVAALPHVPVRSGSADLVYTGKGALIWMPDMTAWAGEVARLLRPGGHFFVYEQHPANPLWTWDPDVARIRPDRSYFGRSFVNYDFPANGAVEWQCTLGGIVTALITAGLEIRHLAEYAEPFWRMGGVEAAAWDGRLPNSFSLLARRPS